MGNGGGAPVLSHSLTPLGVQGLESEGAQAQDLRAPPRPKSEHPFLRNRVGRYRERPQQRQKDREEEVTESHALCCDARTSSLSRHAWETMFSFMCEQKN